MQLLKTLEGLRTPFFDQFFGLITYLGDESVFIVLGMLFLWCFSKRSGYRICYMGMMGNIINQFLKVIFCIPRPWVRDPSFTIVESAREAASGYSFPSGHTQSVTVLFTALAGIVRRKWFSVICAALILTTAFSRMYLGVHTPADVGVSLATGLLTAWLFSLLFQNAETAQNRKLESGLWIFLILFSLAELCYVLFAPPSPNAVAEFYNDGLHTAYVMLGVVTALGLSRLADEMFLHYETRAVWWAQILKCAVGFALLIAIKSLLKAPLLALFHGNEVAAAVRYFLMVTFGGIVWPLTFPLWNSLGRKKRAAESGQESDLPVS